MTEPKTEPAPAAPQTVRYKVVKKIFWNGTLYDPATMPDPYIVAPAGLKSAALQDPNAPPVKPAPAAAPLAGQAVQPIASDVAAKRIAELEDLVRSGTEAVQQLQGVLDHERKAAADKVALLEAENAILKDAAAHVEDAKRIADDPQKKVAAQDARIAAFEAQTAGSKPATPQVKK